MGDGVVEGRIAQTPISDAFGIVRSPFLRLGPGDLVAGQARQQLFGDTADHVPTLPVAHPVDPDDKAASREPAEMIVALQQHDVGAASGSSNRGGGTGGATTDDQHVALGVDRNLAGRLDDRPVRWPAPLELLRIEGLGAEEQSSSLAFHRSHDAFP